jgi:hypothetical protein
MMKKAYLLTLFLITVQCLSFAANAKTVYSIASLADWTDNTHWSTSSGGGSCGCLPDPSKDNINIETNTNSASGIAFGSSATLIISGSATFTITGNTSFANGSVININALSNLTINGDLDNATNSNTVTIDGSITINGDFLGGTGSTIAGGGTMNTTGTIVTTETGTIFGSTTNCVFGPCSGPATLPIKLTSFTASLTTEKVIEINWSTAEEINNDYFTIERSSNGVTFEDITEEPGAGNSSDTIKYKIIDNEPLVGNTYYRLKQTDFDGKFEEFDIIAVSFIKNKDGSCVFKISPNPCLGSCNLSLSQCEEEGNETIQIEIIDAGGNKIISDVPYRNYDGSFNYHINTNNNLAPGVYIVNAKSLNERYTKKMMVK